MCLAQVRLIDTVHLGDLDAFFFERSSRFLVMRSKRLAVPAPSTDDEILTLFYRREIKNKKEHTMAQRIRQG
jgi:hypothetical protein